MEWLVRMEGASCSCKYGQRFGVINPGSRLVPALQTALRFANDSSSLAFPPPHPPTSGNPFPEPPLFGHLLMPRIWELESVPVGRNPAGQHVGLRVREGGKSQEGTFTEAPRGEGAPRSRAPHAIGVLGPRRKPWTTSSLKVETEWVPGTEAPG